MGQASKINVPFNIKTAATADKEAEYYKDFEKIVGISPYEGGAKTQAFTVQGATICSTEHGSRLLENLGVGPFEDDFSTTGVVSDILKFLQSHLFISNLILDILYLISHHYHKIKSLVIFIIKFAFLNPNWRKFLSQNFDLLA